MKFINDRLKFNSERNKIKDKKRLANLDSLSREIRASVHLGKKTCNASRPTKKGSVSKMTTLY